MKTLTAARFAPHLHTAFRVYPTADSQIELELVEVTEKRSAPGQVQFSLVFRGPLEGMLPQQIYRMEHELFGALDLFLVPIAKQPDGHRYEVVFNYLVPTP